MVASFLYFQSGIIVLRNDFFRKNFAKSLICHYGCFILYYELIITKA